jgi:hypothetical protein
VWPRADDPPYLPSADDDACAGAPAWTAELSDADLLRAFHASGFRGDRLRDMRVLSRNQSGRVARLKLDGLVPDEVSGQDLRVAVGRTLGWHSTSRARCSISGVRMGRIGSPGMALGTASACA